MEFRGYHSATARYSLAASMALRFQGTGLSRECSLQRASQRVGGSSSSSWGRPSPIASAVVVGVKKMVCGYSRWTYACAFEGCQRSHWGTFSYLQSASLGLLDHKGSLPADSEVRGVGGLPRPEIGRAHV